MDNLFYNTEKDQEEYNCELLIPNHHIKFK